MRTSEWKKNNTRYLYVILHCHFLNHTKKPKNDFQYKRNNFLNAKEGGGGVKWRIPYFVFIGHCKRNVRVWMSGERRGFTHRKIIYERWAGSVEHWIKYLFSSSFLLRDRCRDKWKFQSNHWMHWLNKYETEQSSSSPGCCQMKNSLNAIGKMATLWLCLKKHFWVSFSKMGQARCVHKVRSRDSSRRTFFNFFLC